VILQRPVLGLELVSVEEPMMLEKPGQRGRPSRCLLEAEDSSLKRVREMALLMRNHQSPRRSSPCEQLKLAAEAAVCFLAVA